MSTLNRSQEFLPAQRNKTLLSNSFVNASYNRSIIDKAIGVTQVNHKLVKSLTWGCVNAALFAILGLDLIDGCNTPWTTVQKIELCLAILIFLNIFYHFCCYIYYFKVKPVEPIQSTEHQLSGFVNEDFSFTLLPSQINDSGASNKSLNLTAFSFDRSRRNESDLNTSINNQSVVNKSPNESPKGTVENYDCNTSLNSKKLIENELLLDDYLKNYDNYEKYSSVVFPEKKFTESLPIWSHPSSIEPPEQLQITQNQYQLAYVVSDNSNNKNKTPPLQFGDINFWNKKGINPKYVTYMCDDLRMWISSTILIRIANEITSANEYFMKHGHLELRIGHTSLEKLRKCTTMQNIPVAISALLPFLEMANHHQYVVHRIQELAKSKCMSDFRWNAGSLLYNGKPWDTHLPTDSALIMHLIATYLDGQLVPLPQQPEGKPFTSQYLSTNISEKPTRVPGKIKIYQTQIHPPCYILVEDTNVHAPPKGRNNLFHTLILFLHYINTKHNGMLGRVSLGPAGVNILWVVGRK